MGKDFISKISNYFKKKTLDSKFKNAGEGHRLSENTRQPILITKPQYIPPNRTDFSESSHKAGEAAIVRDYQNKKGVVHKPKPSMEYNLKADFDKTKDELQKAYELRDRAFGKEKEVDKSQQLTRVYFCCPDLFDYDIICGYDDIQEKIFSYLDSELLENPMLASCLIIQSKCKNKELLTRCLSIIETLVTNIIKSPNETKYRKIRLANEKIRHNIVEVDGAVEYLKAIGFVMEQQLKPDSTEEMESCLIIPAEACIPEKLSEYLENLKQAQPIKPVLYRDTNVYHKNNLVNFSEEDLPAEFFRISLEELKKQNILRKQQIEESGMLLTKTMRENMKIKDKRKYRYVLIRVLFPNNWVLQGTFSANSQLSDITSWIDDCLKVNETYFLSVPPIIRKITNFDQSIVDAELAPCSALRLTFNNSVLNECHNKDENLFLKDQLLS